MERMSDCRSGSSQSALSPMKEVKSVSRCAFWTLAANSRSSLVIRGVAGVDDLLFFFFLPPSPSSSSSSSSLSRSSSSLSSLMLMTPLDFVAFSSAFSSRIRVRVR